MQLYAQVAKIEQASDKRALGLARDWRFSNLFAHSICAKPTAAPDTLNKSAQGFPKQVWRQTASTWNPGLEKPRRKQSIASLRDIAKETDTLLWLAQELLDLSMIESGQAIMRLVETSLSELVETTIERMQDQTNASDLTVISQVPENLQVLCDPDQTRRVLVNLLHNASKWSPPGETITVSAVADDEEVTVSVLDKGPGVPDAQIDRVFERFYQVDASRSGHEGTGLGLAICKHIVEANGGHIWAEGNSKGGGRFKFTLLKAQTRAAQPAN